MKKKKRRKLKVHEVHVLLITYVAATGHKCIS